MKMRKLLIFPKMTKTAIYIEPWPSTGGREKMRKGKQVQAAIYRRAQKEK